MAGATSGRSVAVAAALVAASVWSSSSCSTPSTAHGATSKTATVSASGRVCFGRAPLQWASALHAQSVTSPEGVDFVLGAAA